MELLDRYLVAVRTYLPEAQHEDLITELSENIRAQMEDKAQELGRPLTEGEQEDIIKQHGHPMFVAGRYLPQQYLIGPAVFPVYWFILKTVTWIAFVLLIVAACMTPFVVGIVASIDRRPVPESLQSPAHILWIGLIVMLALYAAVTLVFAGIEHFQLRVHLLKGWSVRQLRLVPKQPVIGFEGRPMPRGQSIALLVVCAAIIVAWITIPGFPMISGFGQEVLEPAPGWQTFRLWLLLYPLLTIIEASVNLVRPMLNWHRPLLAAARLAGMLVLLILAKTGDFVQPTDGATTAGVEWIASVVNSSFFYCALLGLCLGALGQIKVLVQYVSRRVGANRDPAASHIS
jgi:hypothetical protein